MKRKRDQRKAEREAGETGLAAEGDLSTT